MKKFILSYWLGILLLFALFYWDYSPMSTIVNDFQKDITALLTAQLLPLGMMEDYHIFINEHYSLVIEKACNGMIPYLFFLASILAFPASIMHKVKWAMMGYLFISAINVFRIWFVTQFVLQSQNNFSLAHDYLGNALLIVTGLILFISFIKTRKEATSTEALPNHSHYPLNAH